MESFEQVLTDLKFHWAEQGLEPSSPATEAEIAAFEAHHQIVLEDDIKSYFKVLNGIAGGRRGRWDAQHIMFWTLAQVKTLAEETGISAGKNLFVFADWSLWTHAYAFGPGSQKSSVFLVGGRTPRRLASSFRDFICGYIATDPKVLFGYGARRGSLSRRKSG